MKKLRFKIRKNAKDESILYYGIGTKFLSSGLKDSKVNRNIIIGKFKSGKFDKELEVNLQHNVKTIKELLIEVLENKSKTLKYKTLEAYKSSTNQHLIPYFQDTLVTEIKPIDIKKFQDSLVDKKLGNGIINLARILLKEVFAIAILHEWITLNPIKMIEMPKARVSTKKAKPFTLDEIDLILANTKGAVRNFFGISFFTGMRSGELLALKWEDIDFKTDTISINKTVASGYINTPKTESSKRDIEILNKAKEFLIAQRLETGLKNDYVFLSQHNTHYSCNTFFYYALQDVLEKLNIEKRSLHNTRHTFASLMLNNGIEAIWVSNMLGHENLNITLKIYTHYMPKKEKMSIEFLEKRYKNGTHSA